MNDFLCPDAGTPKSRRDIIFKVKNSKKQVALLLLNPQIAIISVISTLLSKFSLGEFLEYFCPLCSISLISDIHKNLAQVIMVDETGENHNVYFSQIVGEHSTFETDGESVHVAGEDAGKYTYFKIGEKFRKYFLMFHY